MANGPTTQIADLALADIFLPYTQQETERKSRIIQSGAMVSDAMLNEKLAGEGLTFTHRSFKDLDDDEENIATDDAADEYTGGNNDSTPKKTGTLTEIVVRLSRNQSWSASDLASDLISADPMNSIISRIGSYRAHRLQKAVVATVNGIFADNAAAPAGTEHVQDDMTHDVSDPVYTAGVTDFSSPAFLDAAITMGDSMEDLSMVMVHSIVYNRMLKNKLIDRTVIDPVTNLPIPTFLGRMVVVDDGLPMNDGVFESWLFGQGALAFGQGAPKVPVEPDRKPGAGNGAGQEILHNRWEWAIHPKGHAYVGAPADGGPSNAGTANNLANADSWQRRFTERKQIKIARLITREFPAA